MVSIDHQQPAHCSIREAQGKASQLLFAPILQLKRQPSHHIILLIHRMLQISQKKGTFVYVHCIPSKHNTVSSHLLSYQIDFSTPCSSSMAYPTNITITFACTHSVVAGEPINTPTPATTLEQPCQFEG